MTDRRPDRGPLRGTLGGLALGGWFVLMLVVCAGLLAKHLLAMPAPATARLGAALGALRTTATEGHWLAIHVLYADCGCSRRVAEHLIRSKRPDDWSELVLWVEDVGDGPEPPEPSELAAKGFAVKRVTTEYLQALGVEAAPMLIALDPFGKVHYVGGYTERKQASTVGDIGILEAARVHDTVEGLPIFGCAVSPRLRGGLSVVSSP